MPYFRVTCESQPNSEAFSAINTIQSQRVDVDVRIGLKVADFLVFRTIVEVSEAIIAEKERILRYLLTENYLLNMKFL